MDDNQKSAIELLEKALEQAKKGTEIPFILGDLFKKTTLKTKSVLEDFISENLEIFIDETIYSLEHHGTKYDNPEIYNYESETVYKEKLAKEFADNSNCELNSYNSAFQIYQIETQNKPLYNKVKEEIEKEFKEKNVLDNNSDFKFKILMKKVSENFIKETLEEVFPNKKELNKGDLKEFLNYCNEKLEVNHSYTKKYTLEEIEKDRTENAILQEKNKEKREIEY